MNRVRPEPAMQVGYVVTELNSSIRGWVEQTGIGPWTVFRDVKLRGHYAGADTTVTMDVAMGYTGELQIELMQITSSSPSPYASGAGEPKAAPHHIAWITDDLEESIAQAWDRGMEVLFVGDGPGAKVAYLRSPIRSGAVYQYIECEGMRQIIAQGIEQARCWDGVDPIRQVC